MIPYGRQSISQDDIKAVVETLSSDFITQGPVLDQFEKAVANYCNAREAVAVTNATSALHLSCLALNIGPEDTVWTSPNSFVASANCALYCGARVDFVDIDPLTQNMSAVALRSKLEFAERENTLPKALIPVHFAGRSCDMRAIAKLANRYNIRVIEDASHALGARYRQRPVGCCDYSDITIFSLHPVKIITSGEGGLAVSNNTEVANRIRLLRNHGITRDSSLFDCESPGGWYYQQVELGYNYRMTELQAALGLSQLRRLDQFVARRRQLATNYHRLLADLPLRRPPPSNESSWHLYAIVTESHRRRAIYDAMLNEGVGVNVHYIPIHTQPYFRRLGFMMGDYPNAEAYYASALTLPLYPDLTDEQQQSVVDSLRISLTQWNHHDSN